MVSFRHSRTVPKHYCKLLNLKRCSPERCSSLEARAPRLSLCFFEGGDGIESLIILARHCECCHPPLKGNNATAFRATQPSIRPGADTASSSPGAKSWL